MTHEIQPELIDLLTQVKKCLPAFSDLDRETAIWLLEQTEKGNVTLAPGLVSVAKRVLSFRTIGLAFLYFLSFGMILGIVALHDRSLYVASLGWYFAVPVVYLLIGFALGSVIQGKLRSPLPLIFSFWKQVFILLSLLCLRQFASIEGYTFWVPVLNGGIGFLCFTLFTNLLARLLVALIALPFVRLFLFSTQATQRAIAIFVIAQNMDELRKSCDEPSMKSPGEIKAHAWMIERCIKKGWMQGNAMVLGPQTLANIKGAIVGAQTLATSSRSEGTQALDRIGNRIYNAMRRNDWKDFLEPDPVAKYRQPTKKMLAWMKTCLILLAPWFVVFIDQRLHLSGYSIKRDIFFATLFDLGQILQLVHPNLGKDVFDTLRMGSLK